jgi:LAO/AO transport system kinase
VPSPLADAVRSRDPRAVARAITLVEDGGADGAALLAALAGAVGQAHRIGITGPPGVGKSTLVAALAKAWRAAGRRVGIVAVDPTSPFSGGALLGDRIRMTGFSGDADVFIRSLASRGALGGVSFATHDVADVLDAAGFDPVVVETVGVGQDEVAVAGVADTVVVVVAPGHGDGIQAMKGGLLEAGDLLVVNQADRDGAEGVAAELRAAVELRALREEAPKPTVWLTSATTGAGVPELVAAIEVHRSTLTSSGLGARRLARARARIRDEVDRQRARAFWAERSADLDALAADVAAGHATVGGAASTLLGKRPPEPPRR